jgi:hypothetical protein
MRCAERAVFSPLGKYLGRRLRPITVTSPDTENVIVQMFTVNNNILRRNENYY